MDAMKNQNIICVLISFTALECSTSTKRTPNWFQFSRLGYLLWPKFESEIGAET